MELDHRVVNELAMAVLRDKVNVPDLMLKRAIATPRTVRLLMETGANGAFGVPAASRVGPERLSGPGDATVRPRDLEEGVLGFLSKANFVMKVLVQEIAGVTGATGANALRHVAAGGNSEFAFAIVRMVRGMRSARVWQRAHKVATAKPVRTGRLLMKIRKVNITIT